MIIPSWISSNVESLMQLPQPYQEFFVRWYYYDNSEKTKLPDTIPVENIEAYITDNMNGLHMFAAKGFAAARHVATGDNLDFKNDGEFNAVCHWVAKLYFIKGVSLGWFPEDVSKQEFMHVCYALRFDGSAGCHL